MRIPLRAGQPGNTNMAHTDGTGIPEPVGRPVPAGRGNHSMLVTQLFHVAIKTPNLEASRRFYTDVLGMTLAQRPQLDFPGIWVQSPVPGGLAVFHIYAGDAALEADGSMASGSGVIDHVAITAHGFAETRERVRTYQLPHREN